MQMDAEQRLRENIEHRRSTEAGGMRQAVGGGTPFLDAVTKISMGGGSPAVGDSLSDPQ